MIFLTVAVPICGNVSFLDRCLDSIFSQKETNYELIVVDDSEHGDKRAKKTFDTYMKGRSHEEIKRTHYISHDDNKGLLQARRTAVENARGEYLLNIDSDDEFADNTVFEKLHSFADSDKVDVVQFGASLCGDRSLINENLEKSWDTSLPLLLYKSTEHATFFEHLFILNDLNTFIWSKMIRTKYFLDVCNEIPFMYCFNREDFLFSFYIAVKKPTFSVHQENFYHYYTGGETGSSITIDEAHWKRTLSISSVYSAILFYLDEHPELEKYRALMQKKYFSAVRGTILLFDRTALEPFRSKAEEMLYEAWGKDTVERVRRAIKKI